MLAALFALAACGGNEPAQRGPMVLKVFVSASGEITADGETVSLEELSKKMAELKKANGAVHYHRENPKGGPHPNAMKVVELVVEHKLSIRMSAKPGETESAAPQTQPDDR